MKISTVDDRGDESFDPFVPVDFEGHLTKLNHLGDYFQPRKRYLMFASDYQLTPQVPCSNLISEIQSILGGNNLRTEVSKRTKTDMQIIDVGTSGYSIEANANYLNCKIRPGTGALFEASALTKEEFVQAMEVGRQQAQHAFNEKYRYLIVGDICDVNYISSVSINLLLGGAQKKHILPVEAKLDPLIYQKMTKIISLPANRAKRLFRVDPLKAFASVCGTDLAAMTGLLIRAVELNIPTVLDNFSAASAAIIAEYLSPGTRKWLMASHAVYQPSHAIALKKLELIPYHNFPFPSLFYGSHGMIALSTKIARINMDLQKRVNSKTNSSCTV